MDELRERVGRLERANRRQRMALVVAGVVLAGMGAARRGPGELTTTRITIVDREGKERATLGMLGGDGGDPGAAYLGFTDARGRDRVGLVSDADGFSALHFEDSAGTTRLSLGFMKGDVPNVRLSDAKGKPRLTANVTDRGPALWSFGPDGAMVERFPARIAP
jgi:hypothetical protein